MPYDFELIRERLDSGELILGGCDVSADSPKWHCHDCGHEWGVSEWKKIIERSIMERDAKYAAAETDAELRGAMMASANAGGYVKCPHCKRTFSIRYSMSWDGKMHKSCHTRLLIANEDQYRR
jgi:phage FluMu protein Com